MYYQDPSDDPANYNQFQQQNSCSDFEKRLKKLEKLIIKPVTATNMKPIIVDVKYGDGINLKRIANLPYFILSDGSIKAIRGMEFASVVKLGDDFIVCTDDKIQVFDKFANCIKVKRLL